MKIGNFANTSWCAHMFMLLLFCSLFNFFDILKIIFRQCHLFSIKLGVDFYFVFIICESIYHELLDQILQMLHIIKRKIKKRLNSCFQINFLSSFVLKTHHFLFIIIISFLFFFFINRCSYQYNTNTIRVKTLTKKFYHKSKWWDDNHCQFP